MNIKLLRRIQKQILKEPRQFKMDDWFSRGSRIPNCGTAACIGGWAIALSRKKNPRQVRSQFLQNDSDIEDTAKKLLRLESNTQSCALFGAHYWPYQFIEPFEEARTAKERAKIAVARIDHFIKTKGE